MKNRTVGETIACPYCGATESFVWAVEIGFTAARCPGCALIYVNPRPPLASIDHAVRTGSHGEEASHLNVVSRRIDAKVARYRRLFARLFDDVWTAGRPIGWLDVGAGYGEIVEAVGALAPPGSRVEGLEPMAPKAAQARARGLTITEDYLRPGRPKVGFVSIVDVFSHIPDFDAFLADVASVLEPGGEIFVETGNLADLKRREEFPGELGLPDHLVFAGEKHLLGYLDRAGFEVVRLERQRIDGLTNLAKNLVKRLLGRPVTLAVPYTSSYRQLLVRARMRSADRPAAAGNQR
jgi:SAM-dependent methyltransferase